MKGRKGEERVLRAGGGVMGQEQRRWEGMEREEGERRIKRKWEGRENNG